MRATATLFEEDAISATYALGGLPQEYSENLTIRMAYTGELVEQSYIAV